MIKTKTKSKRKKRDAWYLKEAPKRVRKKWSLKDHREILQLSTQLNSTEDIIKKIKGLKLSKIQIYNSVRMSKKTLKGNCFQCNELMPDMENYYSRCKSCREINNAYKKDRVKRLLAKGICPLCGRKRVVIGKTACSNCVSISYRRRVKKGICGVCGEEPIERSRSVALGKKCLDKNKRYAIAFRKVKKR